MMMKWLVSFLLPQDVKFNTNWWETVDCSHRGPASCHHPYRWPAGETCRDPR
jgi:hypothetical protein